MAAQAIVDETEWADLPGDLQALFLGAIVLAWLMPQKGQVSEYQGLVVD